MTKVMLGVKVPEDRKQEITERLEYGDSISEWGRTAIEARLDGYRDGHLYIELPEDLAEELENQDDPEEYVLQLLRDDLLDS